VLLDDQIRSNRLKSVAIFGGFFLVYALFGVALSFAIAGLQPELNLIVLVVFGVIAVVVVVFTLMFGDDMAVMVAGGRRITQRSDAPELWDAVETMSIAAGLQAPRIFISPDAAPNAFAAGRSEDQALICVTKGMLELLDKEELEGVIAHELSHIRNLDIRVMTYAAVLAGSVGLISQALLSFNSIDLFDSDGPWFLLVLRLLVFLLAVLLAPVAALLIQLAISRRRELLADASAADLTRYPQGLASALRQISTSGASPRHSRQAIAHLYIMAPAQSKGTRFTGLFSTHPPVAERLARLDGLAGGQLHQHSPRAPSQPMTLLLGDQPGAPAS
jgi:heat shock protein HtpX